MEARLRFRIVVSGLVQGVGFRFFVARTARAYGLTGWVKNRADGTVEVEAEGEKSVLHAFMKELRIGPPSSRVSGVDVEDLPPGEGYDDFDVRF